MNEKHIICPKCNTSIINDKKICYRCGEKLETNKKNTRIIAVSLAVLLLIFCLVIYVAVNYTEKPELSLNKKSITENKITTKKTISAKKILRFSSFNFIKKDNSITTIRVFISEKGFASIPLEYFNNLKEIIWKENGREIVINSGIYWQPDAPFLLLKVPYENQEGSYKIRRYDPSKSVFWEKDNSQSPAVLFKPNMSMPTQNCYTEIDFTGNNASGLLIQDNCITGWTFSFLKDKAYLWNGPDESELKPNIGLETLEILLDEQLQEEMKKKSLNKEKNLMILKELSCFFTNNKPNKNCDIIIISLINKICSNGITEKKYREVLSIITPPLLLRSYDLILLDCYAKANEAIYGYEMTISLLEKLKNEEHITDAFFYDITSLVIKTYINWMQELLYYGKLAEAINTYNIALAQYPDEQELKILGIEIYIKMNNYQKAEGILSNTIFDSKYIAKLQEFKKAISNIKSLENKIIIKFPQNAQRNIFVDCTINNEVSQKFILDTGASMVSIPLATANKLGIDVTNENYTTRIIATASGIFKTKEVNLDSITINGKNIYNVPATIIDLPQDRALGLLGMNFLSRFHMELNNEKGEILLTPKE